jgi:beta-galactosidase
MAVVNGKGVVMVHRAKVVIAAVVAAMAAGTVCRGAQFIWLEGEAGQANVAVNNSGWGNTHFLSEGKWMHVSIDAEKVDAEVKAEAVLIQYRFDVKKAARHEVWSRIGFEFARSMFEYRIDEGPWKAIRPDDLTTDLMEIAFFCEVAWIHMGDAQLGAGGHVLEIRIPKTKDKDGKTQRILYACDAICLTDGPFHPNSRYKPDETGRDEKDEAALKHVFQLPEAPTGARSSVSLKGVWEVTRDDEQTPGEVAEPIKSLPQTTFFKAIEVPSDKNVSRPDLLFAHRLWYRTRVHVPASLAGRAFFIEFPQNSLNTTVYVNGVYCGFEKNPFCRFQIDVTKGVRPGQTNEVWVGIRDAWYGRTADPDRPFKLRRTFNTPIKFFHDGFQDLDYPIWNSPQSGILCTPMFVAAGGIYASDVFVKPLVDRKQLEAEVTLSNSTTKDASGQIRWEAVNDATGQVEKVFVARPFTVPAGRAQTLTLNDAWTNPKLWWPDTPNLYRLRTLVVVGGKTLDTSETTFGYRQWKIEGHKFTLNGVVWHLWADLIGERGPTAESFVTAYRQANVRLMRYMTAGQGGDNTLWYGMEPPEALDFMDRNGLVVRRNTSLDGEAIGSNFSENDAEICKKQGGSKMKVKLMQNWRDQCVAQVKGERNHPSIQIWSIENEFAFINLINLLGNSPLMDEYEAQIAKCHDVVMAVDPTRSVMTDGGGAMKDNTLAVHGDHYVATLDVRYPDQAYEPFAEGGGRGRWKWDMTRPRYIGEDFYANGINPADYAMWGGEVAFTGKAATKDAVATCYRMLQEGYRWSGLYAGWHFWVGGEGGERSRVANAPRAVLVRQWDWTFASGEKALRTFGVFNDTQYADSIAFTRVLTMGGKEAYRKTSQHDVKPGTAEKFDETIPMPRVDSRQEGELLMTLSVQGKEIFRDTKAVSVLPAATVASGAPVGVYDPKGKLKAFLDPAGIKCVQVASLESLPQVKVLIVGPDALSETDATSTALAAFASTGRAVIVLDQANVLKYQALPAEMEPAERTRRNDFGMEIPAADGKTAFIEDASHPALDGLKDKDFFTWPGDHWVYRNAYVKPVRGGKSLIQVGPRLLNSALVEVPVGNGVMCLCQLAIGAKLDQSVVAQRLLVNLLEYGRAYKLQTANVAAVIADEQLGKAMDAIGVQYSRAADALSAIGDADKKIAVISATPASLKVLASNTGKVEAFWNRGGYVLLHGLTPERLADYNKLVGFEHVVRKFKRERVTFPPVRNPLTSGLTTGDVTLLSGKRIFGWTADEYVASDVFTYIVDIDEIAPFATSTFFGWDNMTNGFVGSDGWPLIMDFEAPADGKPYEFAITLPREEYIHDQSVNYNPTGSVTLLFDGKDPVKFDLTPDGEAVSCPINPPRKAKVLTVRLGDYEFAPGKAKNIGMDNIQIKVQRPAQFTQAVKPMLNVGAMVQYAKGSGGVVLCNLSLQDNETVPVNQTKKRTILATVLRNLKAPFAGKTVIAGADVDYMPIDIHTKATTYKDERGFFGDRSRTFKGLPAGRQRFMGVDYDVYEMPTSPVPQVLMLAGEGLPKDLPSEITGIPIRARADALFFLHTARLGRRMNDEDRREHRKLAIFKYVVRYVDGKSEEVPIYSEIDIDHYVQKSPRALPGAQVAWVGSYENSEDKAVAYARQWNNPHPDVEIASVDMVYIDKELGVPALLAITAAKAR